jgi:hypothetical protein
MISYNIKWKASTKDQSLMLTWMKVEGRFSAFSGNQQDKHSIIKHLTFDSAKKFCELAWDLKVKKCHILEQVKSREQKVRYACAANLSFFLFFWLQDEMFTVKIVFSGEVSFRMSGRVKRHNVRTGERQSMQWQAAASNSKCSVQTKVSGLHFLPSVFTCVRSRGRVIGISTRVQGGPSGVRGPDKCRKFFASPKCADLL